MTSRLRQRVLPAVAFVSIPSAVACASVLGIDPITYDPSVADATSETPASGGDAGDERAAPETFCTKITPAPAACFDFDGDDPLAAWRAGAPTPLVLATPVAGAVFMLTSTVAKSPPRAMRFETPSLDPDGGTVLASAQARLPLAAVHAHVRLDFDAQILATPADPAATQAIALGGIEMGLSPDLYKIHFYVLPPDFDGNLKVQIGEVGDGVTSGGPSNEFHFVTPNSGNVARGVWNHFALDVEFPVPTGTEAAARQPVLVTANVTSASTGQTVTSSFEGSAASVAFPIVALGAIAVAGAPPFTGVFDNAVLIDVR